MLLQGYRLGLRTGDLMTACYSATTMVLVEVARHVSVGDVRDSVAMLQRESGQALAVHGSEVLVMASRWAGVLAGELPAPDAGGTDVVDLRHVRCRLQPAERADRAVPQHLSHAPAVPVRLSRRRLPLPPRATERLQALATPMAVDALFFHALVACARLDVPGGLDPEAREAALAQITSAGDRLLAWAIDCPENFSARHALLAAERARVVGRHDEAAGRYKDAIRAARRHGEVGTEALACELASRHAAALGDDVLADMYLQTAANAYLRWGATAKAEQLARTHGLRTRRAVIERAAPDTDAFDHHSLIRAARALSGEIRLERLLTTLLEVAMENAGARRGIVVLAADEGWRVEAEGDADPPAIRARMAIPIEQHGGLPLSIIRYVTRSQHDVLLPRADSEGEFRGDTYLVAAGVRSVLCTPVVHQGRCTGVLYLEHALSEGVFTAARLELIKQLAAQLAVSVENARLVEDLQRARNEAVAAERVKARFLLNMSHELRTPLNAVIGYAELMQESLALGHFESLGGDLTRIRRGAYNLLRTLSGILELSKLASGSSALESAAVDISALLREVAGEFLVLASSRGNVIELVCPPEIGSAYTDRSMLRYCLHSLVENACKFTRDGRVIVKVERIELEGRAQLLVSVSDTGIGIPATHLETIFNAFTQVDEAPSRVYEGTGVGLTVTRQFGRMMGGEVTVVSEVDRGSTFTLRVPVSFVA